MFRCIPLMTPCRINTAGHQYDQGMKQFFGDKSHYYIKKNRGHIERLPSVHSGKYRNEPLFESLHDGHQDEVDNIKSTKFKRRLEQLLSEPIDATSSSLNSNGSQKSLYFPTCNGIRTTHLTGEEEVNSSLNDTIVQRQTRYNDGARQRSWRRRCDDFSVEALLR